MADSSNIIAEALRMLVARCPRLARLCYWAGTSSIALEELGHRDSYDLDFHTLSALQDVRPILTEIERAFPDFQVVQPPDEFGSGFRGILHLPDGVITVEVLSNYDDVPSTDLTPSRIEPAIQRISLARYLDDKIQCVAERNEARDLVDVVSVLRQHPALVPRARSALEDQDRLLIAERLLRWTDEGIERDLRGYPGVDPADAREARDLLLSWLHGGYPP